MSGSEDTFRFVGDHAEDLPGGAMMAPGEFVTGLDVDDPHNAVLIEKGLLIPVPKTTTDKTGGKA